MVDIDPVMSRAAATLEIIAAREHAGGREVHSELSSLASELTELRTQLDDAFDDVDVRHAALAHMLAEQRRAIAALSARVDQVLHALVG